MKKYRHIVTAVKNLKQVGSIVPSSGLLVRKIVKRIDFDKEIKILELGAGNGVITKEILNRMSGTSLLYSYENNPYFISLLEKINDQRLIVKGENVSRLNMLEDGYFDVVVSSLPLANMTHAFKNKVYTDIKSKLKESGTYIQYQYLLSDYKMIGKSFNKGKLGFCLFNLPPAFIYKYSC